jgi:hypothetical protein
VSVIAIDQGTWNKMVYFRARMKHYSDKPNIKEAFNNLYTDQLKALRAA